MNRIDLDTLTIVLNGSPVFTAPAGWAPVPQLAGELDALLAELANSDIGKAHARTREWQRGGMVA